MSETLDRQTAVQRAVSDALEMSLPAFHKQIVENVLAAVEPLTSQIPAPSSEDDSIGTQKLDAAISRLQLAFSQIDILDALLEGVSEFSGRCALFVTRGATAVGWRARGFEENEAVRSFALEFDSPLISQAVKYSSSVVGKAEDFDPSFSRRMSPPDDGKVSLAPLVVREKCAALVYADAQGNGSFDQHAIWSLVRFASLWLEIAPGRRSEIIPEEAAVPPAPSVDYSQAYAEPVPSTSGSNGASNGTGTAAETATALLTEVAPAESVKESQDPVHQKAKRFAKLLVEEIKLYNQGKVEEGRAHCDLYDRLRDDIEKSRASYDKRYATTQVASANYFNKELVRILADNDRTLLGSNFPG